MRKEFDCIVCPMSCHLEVEQRVDGTVKVSGNSCPRGAAFGQQELLEPMRMLTTTVRIQDARYPLLPVITSETIPKTKIFDIMKACKAICVAAPIQAGDILIKDIANSGADLVASRSMERRIADDRSESITGDSGLENI